MNARVSRRESLHPDRLEVKRLAWAFALSLVVHSFVWGGYVGGKRFGIWDKLAWIKTVIQMPVKAPRQRPPVAESEPPLVFVEVNPAVSTTEAPKDAKFYSDKNSQAANPDAKVETDVPKVSGTQEQVAKTDDVRREDVNKLQPSFPKPPEEPPKPEPAMSTGDLALARPDEEKVERRRPRTIQEALTRQQLNKIPGPKMKQDGGVSRRLEYASLDAKATPFGAYDLAFIEAVSRRWYDLLDKRDYSQDRHGRVIVKFELNYDGRISNMKVVENTVGETLGLICQKAVLDPSPFERWPSDMRRMVGDDTREIQFTFFYN
jgi:hypothetical protein